MFDSRPQVLVVGAGPVGLAAAIELGQRGIRVLLIERNDRVGYAPRAKTTNVRTREHMRRWGIADRLAARSSLGIHYPSNVVFCTSLSGPLLARFDNINYCQPGRNPLYAEHAQWIPQYDVEEVMRSHAESLPGVTVRFNTELLSFEQDGEGVRARVRTLEDRREHDIACAYLIGADGARSTVRELIGARMSGSRGIGRHYNVIFKAPGLHRAHQHGPAIMYWQVNPAVPSVLGPMDNEDRWFFFPVRPPEGVKLTDDEMPDLVRKATGVNVPVTVLSSDEWFASKLIADRYRAERVFLAGDACHIHPPFGGFGMNMGISDGVDLGWKLAAILQGWGGAGLLASYETERRPVHEVVLEEAVANHSVLSDHLVRPGLDAQTPAGEALRREVGAIVQAAKMREFYTLGVILGSHYAGSPLVVPDGTSPPAHDFINYRPSATPGCRAPHAWMHDGASLYDRFGPGFTLLALHSIDDAEIDRMVSAASAAGVPLTVFKPGLASIAELYRARYALVRPDQHVAWRGEVIGDAAAILSRVTGRC